MEPSKAYISTLFNDIHASYDRINRILSFGLDLFWRKKLVKAIPKDQPFTLLDLATGTGDQLLEIIKKRSVTHAVGGDISEQMLDCARKKIAGYQGSYLIQTIDAQSICYPEESFDVVTMSFGLRNVQDRQKAIQEMLRVTKKGGRILILEFSTPSNPLLRLGHTLYMKYYLPWMGKLLSGHSEAYRYLEDSVRLFPSSSHIVFMLHNLGAKKVAAKPLSGGIVTLYIATKDA